MTDTPESRPPECPSCEHADGSRAVMHLVWACPDCGSQKDSLTTARRPERGEDGKVVHDGIVFKFGMDGTWPTLLTVMPAKRHGTGRAPGSMSSGDREDNA